MLLSSTAVDALVIPTIERQREKNNTTLTQVSCTYPVCWSAQWPSPPFNGAQEEPEQWSVIGLFPRSFLPSPPLAVSWEEREPRPKRLQLRFDHHREALLAELLIHPSFFSLSLLSVSDCPSSFSRLRGSQTKDICTLVVFLTLSAFSRNFHTLPAEKRTTIHSLQHQVFVFIDYLPTR